jgi:hypothetical protein
MTSDIVERLRGYNPPDRTVDEHRQMSQDIHDAAGEIESLRARVADAEERHSRYVKAVGELEGLLREVQNKVFIMPDLVRRINAALTGEPK